MILLEIMVTSNTLPIYVKRIFAVFLISAFSTLFVSFQFPGDPPDEIKNTIKTVVIDAGHGGRDSGAVGKKAKEKDIALSIALKTGKYIEENVDGVRVIYTRKRDEFVELYKRAAIANENEADLFISIHVNANSNPTPYGTSSHVLGLHRTGEHFDVAVRENSVILLEENYETRYEGFDPTSLESYIIFSLMQDTYLKQSIEFASYIQDQFRERSKRKDRGVIQQGLLVLAQTSMPAVLIEAGFISNPEEEKFLVTEYGQDLIASAIYRAFKRYKDRIEENSHFTIEKKEDVSESQPETWGENSDAVVHDTKEFSENAIVFYVQVVSSKNLVETDPASFNGYENVQVIEQGSWYKYVVGGNSSYHETLDYCSEVKGDFPGAFIIAVKEDKIIPLRDAILEINE
ncbi:MAG: N-acetylmuramoyl-L-alanine amidase [Bacteroidales bacterium]|nr:N-acetylmuramoyl-L-alanine amidase [Bacteroidales bacterium]